MQNRPASLTLEDADLPPEISGAEGASEAEKARLAALAGYVRAGGRWKRIGPDLRSKVNLRRGDKQGDGTFYVADVDVFYPNAVKGEENAYTVADCNAAIANTQAMISAGAQPPALTLEHPNMAAKANGIAAPSHGTAANFRESPRGKGWVRCDFVGMPPNVFQDWKAGKYTGLSAGLVADAGRENLRFGHVALLGGEAQALSRLPMTQVFQAASEESIVCYSAEPVPFHTPASAGSNAPTQGTFKMKTIESLTAELTAAFSAGEAAKCATIRKQIDGLLTANFDSAELAKGGLSHESVMVGKEEDPEPDGAGEGIESDLDLPDASEGSMDWECEDDDSDDHGAGKGDTFAAKQDARIAALERELALTKAVNLKNEFSAQVDALVAKGHEINKDNALAMFSANLGNKNGMTALCKFLEATPKRQTRSGVVAFSAEEAGTAATKQPEKANFAAEAATLQRQGIKVTAQDLENANLLLGLGR